MSDEARHDQVRFHCDRGHRWADTLPLPMEVREVASRMAGNAACPTCGSKAYLGWKYAPPTAPDAENQEGRS